MAAYERTFVLVIDEERARFYARNDSGSLRESLQAIPLALPPHASAEIRRHARLKFLQSVATALSGAADRAEFERLIAIAPERTLMLFRKHAPDKVRARLWRERANELVIESDEQIAKWIAPYFRRAR